MMIEISKEFSDDGGIGNNLKILSVFFFKELYGCTVFEQNF